MKYIFELTETPVDVKYPILVQKKMDNGITTPKTAIDIPSVVRALNELYDKQHELDEHSTNFDVTAVKDQFTAPDLPFGTVHFQTGTMIKSEHLAIEQVAIILPKDIFPALYHGEPVMLGFPNLLFVFNLTFNKLDNTRRLRDGYVFAIKEKPYRFNGSSPLYTFPFPNVSKGDGKICWGNTATTIKGDTLSAFVQSAIDTFVTSNFNDDYGIALDDKKIANFKDYIENFANEPFNEGKLIPNLMNGDLTSLLSTNGKNSF